MIWASNAQCETTYLSPQWEEFTGQSVEDGRGDRWSENIHPDDVEVVRSTFRRACAEASSFWMIYRLKHQGDGYAWVLSGANPSHDTATGHFLGFLGSINAIETRGTVEAHGELAPFHPLPPSPETPPKSDLEMLVDLGLVARAVAEESGESGLLEAVDHFLDLARDRLLEEQDQTAH